MSHCMARKMRQPVRSENRRSQRRQLGTGAARFRHRSQIRHATLATTSPAHHTVSQADDGAQDDEVVRRTPGGERRILADSVSHSGAARSEETGCRRSCPIRGARERGVRRVPRCTMMARGGGRWSRVRIPPCDEQRTPPA